MNRYTVNWSKIALDGVAKMWVESLDRKGLSRACDSIDAQLAIAPSRKGKELSEGLHRIVIGQVAAYYAIDEESRIVLVETVRRAPPLS